MTSQEDIAYLRDRWLTNPDYEDAYVGGTDNAEAIAAVCTLAERALLTDDETEAVRRWCDWSEANRESWVGGRNWEIVLAVLRRLLPDEPAEHRVAPRSFVGGRGNGVYCSCGWENIAGSTNAAVRAWAAHAGIGGTE